METVEMNLENFSAYGKYLNKVNTNEFKNEEFQFTSDIGKLKIDGVTTIGMLTAKQRNTTLTKLERHVESPEMLIVLKNNAQIVVANHCEINKYKNIKKFKIQQGDVFIINKGVWHWVPYPLNEEDCKLLVVFKEGTTTQDTEFIDVSDKYQL